MSTFQLDQKKLTQIRQQLYGKQTQGAKISITESAPKSSHHPNTISLGTENLITKDLTKIVIFSVLAITLQLLIHTALLHKWLTINFYGITY